MLAGVSRRGHRGERPRRLDRLRLRRRRARALRIAAGARLRRRTRARAAFDRQRHARDRCRARRVHAAGPDAARRSPARRTIRCATRSATRRTRWSRKASRIARSRWRRTAASISPRSATRSRRRRRRRLRAALARLRAAPFALDRRSASAHTRRSSAPRRGVPVLVDNCYGELVEEREPRDVGADLVMGSLIKNLGGSLAPAGGYVAGPRRVGRARRRAALRAGLGHRARADARFRARARARAVLCAAGHRAVAARARLRGGALRAARLRRRSAAGRTRTDIVQAIRLGDAELLRAFAAGLQAALPINARFRAGAGAGPGLPRSR